MTKIICWAFYLVTNVYSTLLAGSSWLGRAADTVGNAPLTWLVVAVVASWSAGVARAYHLQGDRRDHCQLKRAIHANQCDQRCVSRSPNWMGLGDEYSDLCQQVNCSAPRLQQPADHFSQDGKRFHQVTHHCLHTLRQCIEAHCAPGTTCKDLCTIPNCSKEDQGHFIAGEMRRYHLCDHQVKHTPQQCAQQHCDLSNSENTYEEEDLCTPCSRPHFTPEDGVHYHTVSHWGVTLKPLPLWKSFVPCCSHNARVWVTRSLMAVGFAWSVGRLPFSIHGVKYGIALTIVQFTDSLVIAHWVIGDINVVTRSSPHRDEVAQLGYPDSKVRTLLPSTNGWKRRPAPLITLAAFYFGLRIADGWLMAKMAVHQLPFVSLAGKLVSCGAELARIRS
jgi:hypothetical protein